ncbi:MAG: polysaccharide deacetylase [Oscillospiraceae bacterium]|nr:polysaccharide deacetylase [Oscillospiraceae bacterium]MDD5919705.1 polysaccharide deacetylase [Oscillospiraceae bacterium]HCU32538.1 polysaccharide deacetylase [Oscillospiraceae bacterium]
MFCLIKCSRKKVLAAAAALLCLGGILTAVQQTKAVSGPAYEDLYPDMYVNTGNEFAQEEGKVVYYTFDDGPSQNTIAILDTLKEKGVKATFFVTGQEVSGVDSDAILKRIVDEGHSIGMHTYSHVYQQIYSSVENYLADFYKIRERIIQVTGVEPKIFRFPGGSVKNSFANPAVQKAIRIEMRRRGYLYYDWNLVSGDDKSYMTDTNTLIRNIVNGAQGKDKVVILCHDDPMRVSTAEAVGPVIDQLTEQGYRFEKLTESVEPIQFHNDDEA